MAPVLAAISLLRVIATSAFVLGLLLRRATQAGWELEACVPDDDPAWPYRKSWVDEVLRAQELQVAWSQQDDAALTQLLREQAK